ncbi:primosomal protein N' [Synechococcus sp. RSCCF101]|uniref:replication restart helicase PriA n=1 Tax=Synechococcus sp. RSCCF101 TaxID=2511069 RepID=UPI001248FEDB|nr:primosomal protein N' [Synechococcus sp. RSCCF101]QEY31396.1 primosomal protein N' [Synechococcus sp. RSCCF101]
MSAASSPVLDVWLHAGRDGRVFSYRNHPDTPARRGDLVRVQLRGASHSGLVVAERPAGSGQEIARLRTIDALQEVGVLQEDWWRWLQDVARLCHCSLFRTLRAALPPGWLGRARPAAGGSDGRPRQPLMVRLSPGGRQLAEGVGHHALTVRQGQLVAQLWRHGGGRPLRQITAGDGFSRSVVQALERRELVTVRPQDTASASAAAAEQEAVDAGASLPELTDEQQRAMESVHALAPGEGLLVWGVTGSGKTELYLRAAAAVLARGESVLMLAPEIGLVPQLLDRCRQRFGYRVLEYHSGCSPAQRVRTWQRCRRQVPDRPLLVVGTRSAIFLPLPRPGLIVLDEEHDRSYKQEAPMPCYHCRELARLRCRRSGARLILGSATPSLESWRDCRSGRGLRLARLRRRVHSRPLPPVRVVDMRLELAAGHRRLVSRALKQRLERLREAGNQAVILVPRRGFSSFVSCRSCGTAVQCPHCDVSLTVHRRADGAAWLSCHWCGHREPCPTACRACGSRAFKPFGAGTQRVVQELGEDIEGLRLMRFDRDTTRGRDGHRRLLTAFASGAADVLVGTQMLAKGMDLPRVTLAVVLAADGLLHRPDLRSGEECLQLLLQLAGRAGRGERPGEVIVQTYSPDHPVLRHFVEGAYEPFLEEELSHRRAAGLVPFARACLLQVHGLGATATATAATALAEGLEPYWRERGWLAIGPAPAPVARVAGRSRWQLLLHGPEADPLPLPAESVMRGLIGSGIGLTINPDPQEL